MRCACYGGGRRTWCRLAMMVDLTTKDLGGFAQVLDRGLAAAGSSIRVLGQLEELRPAEARARLRLGDSALAVGAAGPGRHGEARRRTISTPCPAEPPPPRYAPARWTPGG